MDHSLPNTLSNLRETSEHVEEVSPQLCERPEPVLDAEMEVRVRLHKSLRATLEEGDDFPSVSPRSLFKQPH